MSESRFEEMKRYARFGDEEARLLRSLGAVAAPSFEPIVADFYDRIREHEEAHAVFTGEAQIARLQRSMIRWLTRLCGGTYDEAYFAETVEIGRVHVRVGLPQRYIFTAMALIRVALLRIVDREMGVEAPRAREALVSLLDLDLAIILESYREDLVARSQQSDRLEREELGRSLARVEHRYESAVELARVMIIGLDVGGQIQLWNREAERVTGFGRDEAIGKDFVELLHRDDSEDRTRMVRALGSGAPSEVFHGTACTRSGHVRIVRWQVAKVPSDTVDDVVRFVVGQDTTEETTLAETTRRQERLTALGTLAAGLAHEIRNPLNGAQLHVAYLKRSLARSDTDRDLLDAATAVGDEIQRLATFVTEFLDFARPQPIVRHELSAQSLCDRALQMVRSKANAQQVAVRDDLPSHDVVLYGDADRLGQALLCLLDNAIEAAAGGQGSTVTLRARRQPRHLVLEVEDDGVGVVGPDSPIFDAFFSTKPSGTGLGLAITHRIVTDHSGTIEVDSHPGRTIFRVTLPLNGPGEGMIDAADDAGQEHDG